MFTKQFGLVGTLGAGYFDGKTELMPLFSDASSSHGFTTNLTPSIVFFWFPSLRLALLLAILATYTRKTLYRLPMWVALLALRLRIPTAVLPSEPILGWTNWHSVARIFSVVKLSNTMAAAIPLCISTWP
jgi:hypothetical protein